MNDRTRTTRRGFTLLELVLVLLMVGVAMAVAAPSLVRWGGRSRVDHAAILLCSLLNEARSRAITEARAYQLVVDPAGWKCWLTMRTEAGFVRPLAEYGRVYSLDGRLSFHWQGSGKAASHITIQFEPDGRVQPGQIVVFDGGGRSAAVYCLTPGECYRMGEPVDASTIEQGAVDAGI